MPNVTINRTKSYLAMIRNAAAGENRMFRSLIASVDGVESDILKDGALSCAFFASAILYINKLIGDVHAGVPGLERDLAASGWQQISDLREGAVIAWEAQKGSFVPGMGEEHGHIGFYIGNDRAVSNGSNTSHVPEEHHVTYDGTRKIVRIWWHAELE
ncbi:MAG: hypothetical protein IT406_02010 [Candidatus Yanofskybacteria bacterium]|nr:hypothetical protein [Candidatus Yanofskybacteria bacterium]